MNQIRAIQALNKREIENGISPDASWHVDYRDTAFVYFGGLPYDLSEGDVITLFSQFGEPTFLKLVRDKETGKSKGFGWLKYEDQRSTDLAVDNLGGADVGGKLLRVDHARYKARDDEDPDEFKVGWEDLRRREGLADERGSESGVGGAEDGRGRGGRGELQEERELALLIRDHDDDDPMKEYLVGEKKKEVEDARRRAERREKRRHDHRSRRDGRGDDHDSRERSRRDEKRRDRDDSRDRHRRHRDDDDHDDDHKNESVGDRSRRREARGDRHDPRDKERERESGGDGGRHTDGERYRRRRDQDDSEDERRRRRRDRDAREGGGERHERRSRPRSRSRSPRRREN